MLNKYKFQNLNKFYGITLLSLFSIISLNGCSSEKELPPVPEEDVAEIPEDYPSMASPTREGVKYQWMRSGIKIEYYSTTNLNEYALKPHNLMLCVYQLKDDDNLKKNIELLKNSYSSDATIKLLSCETFDDSIVSAKRIFIAPKQHKTVILDREKEVKTVLLVAGYNYNESNLNMNNFIFKDIPINYAKTGLVFKSEEYTSGILNIRLFVGKNQIQDLRFNESFKVLNNQEEENNLKTNENTQEDEIKEEKLQNNFYNSNEDGDDEVQEIL